VNVNTSELPAGHYVVIATIYENAKYLGNTTTKEFDIIKLNSTVNVTVTPDGVHYVGDSFTIKVTNNTAAVVTINGKEYAVNADGTVDVATADLAAGDYTVIATIPESKEYYGNSFTVMFSIVKHASSVNVTVGSEFVYGTAFNITVENSTAVNVTINGKAYSVNAYGTVNVNTSELPAGHYVVIATIYENAKYLGNTTTKEFDIIKLNSTVNVTVTPDGVHYVGDSFTIKVTNNTVAKVTINGKEYAILSDGTVDVAVADLAAGEYTVVATTPENAKYYGNESTANFTIIKKASSVKVSVDPTHMYGTVFNITVENNTFVNVTINGKAYSVNADGTVNVDTSELSTGHYVVIATIYENAKYLGNTTTKEFDIIKLNSTVNVTVTPDTTHYVGDSFTIKVANNTAAVVTINGKEYAINADGTVNVTTADLAAGNYTVIATTPESKEYYSNSSTIVFSIVKHASSVNVTVGSEFVYGTTFNITVENNTVVNVTINGQKVNVKADGTLDIDSTTLPAGHYVVIATIYENAKYLGNTSTKEFNIIKLNSTVNVTVTPDDVHYVGDSFTIKVANNTVAKVTINGKEYAILSDGTVDVAVADLAAGEYTVVATTPENAKYYGNESTAKFTIIKKASSVNVTVTPDGVHYVGDSFTIKVANNTVAKVTINGKEYAILSDGTVDVAVADLAAGEYTVVATTPENVKYYGNESNATFTILKIATQVNVTVTPDATHYVGDSFTIKVTNSTAAKVTVNGREYAINADGTVNIDTTKLAAGEYTVTAVIVENEKYLSNTSNASFTIEKLSSTVKVHADDINYTQDAIIIVEVPKEQTGYATVTVNGNNYTALIKDGKAVVNVSGLNVKTYSVKAYYLGDDKYLSNNNQSMFEVYKSDLTASVVGQNVTNKDNASFVVKVPENFQGKVNITVDGKTYSGDAQSIIKMDKLTTGEKTANVVFWDDPNYNDLSFNTTFKVSNVTDAFNITTIKADNLTRGYNSIYDFQATFLDSDGKALVNATVQFKVGDKTYTAKTNDAGVAQLTTSHLDVGTYNVTSINPATGESTVNKLEIVKRIIKNKDMTVDFLSGKYYVVQVIGDDGKPVGAGEIVDIYANTIHYVAKTDKNGYARLKINLNPKTYYFHAEYKTFKTNKNKIVVKQTLKLVKKTVKVKKGKKIVLKAKLKWSSGKAIKGKKIVFKFKGKKYSAKTNKKGIAKVTIKKKSVLKKLKKGKKYKFTAAYKTNKVKGKVKIKK